MVMPGRHSLFGFRLMMVSNISVGAGSVAVVRAARLAEDRLPPPGSDLMIRSCVCSSSAALVTDRPGSVVGMYSSVPSLRFGMNSRAELRARARR